MGYNYSYYCYHSSIPYLEFRAADFGGSPLGLKRPRANPGVKLGAHYLGASEN